MGVDSDPSRSVAQKPRQGRLAHLEPLATQILAIELDEVEGAQQRGMVVVSAAQISKVESPFSSTTMASPSRMQERTLRAAMAPTAAGKRSVKSLPRRLNSLTFPPARTAMMRKPSCLISCTQPGPVGGLSTERGRHGSMKPERGRGRARNNMAADGSALSFSEGALLLALRPLLEDTIALANGQPAAASWHMPRARLLLGQDYCRRTGDGARAAGPSSTALDDLLPKPAKKVRDGI